MKNFTFQIIIIIFLSSCQNVIVSDNEKGVHFKRFGGGVDTTKVYKKGSYLIPNWDYFVKYDTRLKKGNIIEIENGKITIRFESKLNEKDVGKFHRSIGGDPTERASRIIEEELINFDFSKINLKNKFQFQLQLFEKCKSKLSKEYIELSKLSIEL